MRLPAARVAAFLRQPDSEARAVLLYGPDAGLARERADTLARSVCADLQDPFRVVELRGAVLAADPARLTDEAAQMSLMGGRRVLRVRDAGDRLAALFRGFLADAPGDGFVVIEAGDLPSSSALRRVFDATRRGVAIGCYSETARERLVLIRDALKAHRITVSEDAVRYLSEHLGGDRLLVRSELEKLALYIGEVGRVELDDARLSVGDSAALEVEDAVMAALEGAAGRLDRVLDRVFQDGESPVSIVRALLRHVQRLHALAAQLAAGVPLAEIMRAARPPIFYKQQEHFKRQLAKWSDGDLRAELERVAQAELHMKLTGLPAETICRAAMSAVAQDAQRLAQRKKAHARLGVFR
jgi:DNA polymerase III subunit delta